MDWIHPRVITGPPAETDRYLRRQHVNDKFWRLIANGEPIVLVAPRRVGKSSVMKDLARNPIENHLAIHENIESDKTQQDFFKRLLNMLLNQKSNRKKYYEKAMQWAKARKLKGFSVYDGSVEIGSTELNYKEELLSFIDELGDEETKVVLLLDEFPDVLMSIKEREGAEAAEEVLNTIREIQHNEHAQNFHFVLAGSVGIDHVVNSIGRPKLLNLFHPLRIDQLTIDEAYQLTDQLTIEQQISMQIDQSEKEYLIKKIEHRLPYFIQLMIEKCDDLLSRAERPQLSKEDIDQAFNAVVEEGRNFEDWEKRLNKYLHKADATYCIDMLTRCAHFDAYSVQEAYNKSKTLVPETSYKELIDNTLVKDGYLVEQDGRYKFLSPFLREWWKKRHPKFEIED